MAGISVDIGGRRGRPEAGELGRRLAMDALVRRVGLTRPQSGPSIERFYGFVGDCDPAIIDAWHFGENRKRQEAESVSGRVKGRVKRGVCRMLGHSRPEATLVESPTGRYTRSHDLLPVWATTRHRGGSDRCVKSACESMSIRAVDDVGTPLHVDRPGIDHRPSGPQVGYRQPQRGRRGSRGEDRSGSGGHSQAIGGPAGKGGGRSSPPGRHRRSPGRTPSGCTSGSPGEMGPLAARANARCAGSEIWPWQQAGWFVMPDGSAVPVARGVLQTPG